MEINGIKITAEEGMVLRRISDKQVFGSELYLGFTYYLNGKLLNEPLYELPEHYEEVIDEIGEGLPSNPKLYPYKEENEPDSN